MDFEVVRNVIAETLGCDLEDVKLEASLADDLGADSLDLVDMLMTLEDEFNIGEVPDEMVEKIRTVGQLVTYIEENM